MSETNEISEVIKEKAIFSLELFLAKFLKAGVWISSVLIVLGWIISTLNVPTDLSQFQHYSPQPLTNTLLLTWFTRDWGSFISYAGILILIILPFSRVIITTFVFLIQKEYLMASITALVLFGLVLSFALGFDLTH